MNKLTLTAAKIKLPIKPKWEYVRHLLTINIARRPVDRTSELDILRVLVFNSIKHHIGNKEVGEKTITQCDSFIFGYRLKLQNRRFKQALIASLLLPIIFSIIIVLLQEKSVLTPISVSCWIALMLIFWAFIFAITNNSILDYLSWKESCSFEGLLNVKAEDPVFLDLPYIVLLVKGSFHQHTPGPLNKFEKFGTDGIENDIRLVEQALFDEMIFIARQIDEARSGGSVALQKSILNDLEIKLYNLVSISVHLNLFGSKPEDSLDVKKDLCKGLYLRAFLAMQKIRHDQAKEVTATKG